MFTPSTHVEIIDEKNMIKKQPDYALILSWHYGKNVMKNLRNKVQLIGNLGNNPEIINLESGKKLAKFSIATNENYKKNILINTYRFSRFNLLFNKCIYQ